MPILYLDEDISPELADLLIAPNRLIRSARSERRLGAGDPYQLIYAAEQEWTLVTCNRRHYHLLHDAWLLWSHRWGMPHEHAGILTLDQGYPAQIMAAAIEGILSDGVPKLRNAAYDWTAHDEAWKQYHP